MQHQQTLSTLSFLTFALAICCTSVQGKLLGHNRPPTGAQAQDAQSALADAGTSKPESGLTKVDPKKICMLTNKLFDKEQIPVPIKGRTYYGCCKMCKADWKKIQNSVPRLIQYPERKWTSPSP
jgi:hypothetical protein